MLQTAIFHSFLKSYNCFTLWLQLIRKERTISKQLELTYVESGLYRRRSRQITSWNMRLGVDLRSSVGSREMASRRRRRRMKAGRGRGRQRQRWTETAWNSGSRLTTVARTHHRHRRPPLTDGERLSGRRRRRCPWHLFGQWTRQWRLYAVCCALVAVHRPEKRFCTKLFI